MAMHRSLIGTGLLLSIWVFVSPWVVPGATGSIGLWAFQIPAAVGVLLAVVAFTRSDDLAEYGLIAVAIWLIISPWVLGLSELLTRQAVFYGVIIGGLAWFGRPSYKSKSSGAA
jgi:SPW repeat